MHPHDPSFPRERSRLLVGRDLDQQRREWRGCGHDKASYTIYIPDGTYRIKKTIVYSGPTVSLLDANGNPIPSSEAFVQLRFIGQSREKTILQLEPGTFAGKPGAVLAFGKKDFNNLRADNAVRNLTIDVKSNNAMATGIYFGGANAATIDNVAVVSDKDRRSWLWDDDRPPLRAERRGEQV